MPRDDQLGMPDPLTERAQAANAPTPSAASAAPATVRVRSSSFKYYIHDSTDALRLKLIGEFTEADVTELNGCWRTARTTIATRKLVLDLRALIAVDEVGKQWLAAMSAEGASYVPEDYLLTCLAGQHASAGETPAPRRVTLVRRLASLFRGARLSAPSSIQEP
jgi:hypothetical protein